jgi:ketosteroid isomerase-like protein
MPELGGGRKALSLDPAAARPTVRDATRAAGGVALVRIPLRADDGPEGGGMTRMMLLVLSSMLAQSVPPERAADAAKIRAEIERICQAFVDKDRDTLVATHGRDWRGFVPLGDHVIRGIDGYMNEATFPPGAPKGQGMVGYHLSDFDVVFYGDTAVASFLLVTDVAWGGEKGVQKLTILDVFHKEPTGWVQVASNTSLHPDELQRRVAEPRQLGDDERKALLAAREAVWRAWFAGDTTALTALVPPDLVTIEGSGEFGTLASNVAGARGFAASGGKLTRIVFPRTEIQTYGATAVLYTTYELDLLADGKTATRRGAATEVFVQRDGKWINTGWQLAPIPAAGQGR